VPTGSMMFQALHNTSIRVTSILFDVSNLDDVDKADRYLPDLIAGDLDSIRPDVQGYYTSKVHKN
jgi:thiamine pyrophosphokinase